MGIKRGLGIVCGVIIISGLLYAPGFFFGDKFPYGSFPFGIFKESMDELAQKAFGGLITFTIGWGTIITAHSMFKRNNPKYEPVITKKPRSRPAIKQTPNKPTKRVEIAKEPGFSFDRTKTKA